MNFVSPQARSRAHWIVGAAGLVAFLASGLAMHFRYDHLHGFDRATRLSFRSIHIYLLFSALLNLGVAPRVVPYARRWAETTATIGALLILAGPILLGIAFVEEPLRPDLDRDFTRAGVMACAAGTLLSVAARAATIRSRRRGHSWNTGGSEDRG